MTPEQQVKVGKYEAVNGTNLTLDCAAPFKKYCTKKWYYLYLWNVTDDDTINSTYCDNISIFSIIHIVLYMWWPLGSFQLLFPYCTHVVKISTQKLCVVIKRWLPGSHECFLLNRFLVRNSQMFSVVPIYCYTVQVSVLLPHFRFKNSTCPSVMYAGHVLVSYTLISGWHSYICDKCHSYVKLNTCMQWI